MWRVNSLNVQRVSEPGSMLSEKVSRVGYHMRVIRREISRVADVMPNLRCRSIFELEMNKAMQHIRKELHSDDLEKIWETQTIFEPHNDGVNSPQQCGLSRYQPPRNRTVRSRNYVVQTFLGSIHVESKTFHMQPKCSSIRLAQDPQSRLQYEYHTCSVIMRPAPWLVNRGFHYNPCIIAVGSLFWDLKLEINRAVPDDSSVFEFCRQGNISSLKTLLARGQASTKDVDSQGRTPIYVSITV